MPRGGACWRLDARRCAAVRGPGSPVGTGSWAAGQAVWTYYEIVLGTQVPFPSLADVGFLGFPLASAVGLVLWLGGQNHELVARGRDVLDGALIAGSLATLSWVTALSTTVAGGGTWFPLILSLAYPVGDLILATLVLLALARARDHERPILVLLAIGLGGLAVADSAYLFLVSTGQYSSADIVSSGWVVGFLMVAAGGINARSVVRSAPVASAPRSPLSVQKTSRLRIVLPYVPLVVALAGDRRQPAQRARHAADRPGVRGRPGADAAGAAVPRRARQPAPRRPAPGRAGLPTASR